MKVLITGGGGYLGSILTNKLLDSGYSVRVVDALWYGSEPVEQINNNNLEIVREDIRDLTKIVSALRGIDAVIHLASIVGMPASSIEPRTSEEINYLATKNIAELCELHGIGTYIFASTCSVYGSQPDALITEKSAIFPLDYYAKSKFQSERAINWLNTGATILRFGTLYGLSPRMRFDLVINLFIAQALHKGKITVFGGKQYRPFLHVQDAAESLIFALEKDLDGVYNVMSENMTIMQAAEQIRDLTGCQIEVSNEECDKRNYRVSAKKIERFGFSPSKDIKFAFEEIRRAFEEEFISDYTEPRYSNYKMLFGSEELRNKVFVRGFDG